MKWFRFYSEALHDPKVRRLPPALFKDWVLILCIASDGKPRGTLPPISDIAYHLSRSSEKVIVLLTDLKERGLLDAGDEKGIRPHNWNGRQFNSDNVTSRVRKHREGVARNVTETPPDTDTEQRQNRTETEIGA